MTSSEKLFDEKEGKAGNEDKDLHSFSLEQIFSSHVKSTSCWNNLDFKKRLKIHILIVKQF